MNSLLIFIVGFLTFKTFSDSGAFKSITPHYNGNCLKIKNVSGPEDITISKNGLAFISCDNRRATLAGAHVQGSIFLYDLNNTLPKLINLTKHVNFEFHPHGISIYENENEVFIFVVNHRLIENTIEVFKLLKSKLIHQDTIRDSLLISPNDIIAINQNQFYVTNDHGNSSNLGKLFEDYLQLSKSNVVYFNGYKFDIVVSDLKYANGINLNKNKTKVYVAETTGRRISIYNRDKISNKLLYEHSIHLNSGVDNIEIDNKGSLWIGSHPQVLKFVKHAKNKVNNSPSQVIKIDYIDKNDYMVHEVYLDNGSELSGSSVASIYKNILLIGAVFSDYFLICDNN